MTSLFELWQRHRERVLDASWLLLAMNLPRLTRGWPAIPWGPQLVLLAVFALVSAPRAYLVPEPWQRYRRLLPGYFTSAASGVAILALWFKLPLLTALSPLLWLPLTLLPRLHLANWLARSVAGLRAHRLETPVMDSVLLILFSWSSPLWSQSPGPDGWMVSLLILAWCLAGRFTDLVLRPWSAPVLATAWGALWLLDGIQSARPALVFGCWLGLSLFVLRAAQRRWAGNPESGTGEVLRWAGLLFVTGGLFHPFFQAGVHGTSEAQYYATVIADALQQFRHGVFPVFVGQSEYQFNGSVMPIRVAPAFPYAGGLVDLLTARLLNPMAVQNLLIVLVATTTGFSAYACGRRLGLPAPVAWVAGVLYLSCPGVLGLVYNSDLYMSWMVVPWVPLAFTLALLSFSRAGPALCAKLGAVVGATWWCHSPIALWLTVSLVILQAVRLCRSPFVWKHRAVEAAAGGLAFLAVAAYPLASVTLFPADPSLGAGGGFVIPAAHIGQQLRQSFPALWLPVSELGRGPGDLQLGWGLLALGLFLSPACWRSGRTELRALVGLFAGFLLLLLPVPYLNHLLWQAVPATMRAITNVWPMQRFQVLLAMVVVGIFALAWSAGRRPTRLWLAIACVWSLAESWKFVAGSWMSVTAQSASPHLLAPENITLTRYAYVMFRAKPPYFTHGTTDPVLENRLLGDDLRSVTDDNYGAARRSARPPVRISFVVVDNHLETAGPVQLEPERRYLVTLTGTIPHGTLELRGGTLQRIYAIPEYGEARSFGFGDGRNPYFPLHTTRHDPESVRVRVLLPPTEKSHLQDLAASLAFVLAEYDPTALPVRVTSWMPYRATVQTDRPVWLETPRSHQPGYAATVSGRPAEVRRSEYGLVAVSVPAGRHEVELRYVAPAGLQAAFWISVASLAAGGVWSARTAWRKPQPPDIV